MVLASTFVPLPEVDVGSALKSAARRVDRARTFGKLKVNIAGNVRPKEVSKRLVNSTETSESIPISKKPRSGSTGGLPSICRTRHVSLQTSCVRRFSLSVIGNSAHWVVVAE